MTAIAVVYYSIYIYIYIYIVSERVSPNLFDLYILNYIILNNFIYDAYAPYLIQ